MSRAPDARFLEAFLPVRVDAAILEWFDEDDVRWMVEQRNHWRRASGGEGCCDVMALAIADRFGGRPSESCYATAAGEPICMHHFTELHDGSILDCTADQFAEGHDIRVVHPHDPDYARYRMWFTGDRNPSTVPEWRDLAWTGVSDREWFESHPHRAEGWWLQDPAPFLAWQAAQPEMSETPARVKKPSDCGTPPSGHEDDDEGADPIPW